MQVLLLKKREGLGNEGDIVPVTDGYARNFLLPRKFAVKATKNTIELQKKLITERGKKVVQELEEYKALAERISCLSLTVPEKVGEDDRLYGSVTASDIVKLMKEEGIAVYQWPERLEVVPGWPLTALNKIDKRLLRAYITNRLFEEGTISDQLGDEFLRKDKITLDDMQTGRVKIDFAGSPS